MNKYSLGGINIHWVVLIFNWYSFGGNIQRRNSQGKGDRSTVAEIATSAN